jgi:hypothetical protein
LIFGLLTTAFGFFIAIYLNDVVQREKDLDTFLNIQKSIEAEMNENETVLDSSFTKFIDGVIFNELNTLSSSAYLTNEIFLEHATPQFLIALQNYIHLCNLCNTQKKQLKDFRLNERYDEWASGLQIGLTKTIKRTKESIEIVKEELKDKQ